MTIIGYVKVEIKIWQGNNVTDKLDVTVNMIENANNVISNRDVVSISVMKMQIWTENLVFVDSDCKIVQRKNFGTIEKKVTILVSEDYFVLVVPKGIREERL